MSNLYDNEFYDEMYERNKKTAQEIMPFLISKLHPKSIVDIGCGRGIFLEEAEKQGIEVLGIDGDYIEQDKLLIRNFMGFDLTKKLELNRKFDLAISFEVAEHIDEKFSELFVDNLTSLSSIIAFSAAIPMQGGVGHINEQWPTYWEQKFAKRGYRASNCLRHNLWDNSRCAKLRKQNIILYIESEQFESIESRFFTQKKLFDIVHPQIYTDLQEELKLMRDKVSILKENEKRIRENSLQVAEIESYLTRDEKNNFYYRMAHRKKHMAFWDMVDQLEKIKYWSSCSTVFKDNLSCYQLDNYEKRAKTDSYVVWGAGYDGNKVIELLNILGKKHVIWCDKKADKRKNVIYPEEMYGRYDGQIIIIASRKYWHEIADEIVTTNPEWKKNIFLYDFNWSRMKREEEYRKKAIVSYPPLWITIGVTSACKNKCLFCSYHGDDAKNISNAYGLSYMLSYEDFTKIVDMAYQAGVAEIHICGTGEPFLNPNILRMIDYVIYKYGEVSLQTEFWKTLFEGKNLLDELIKREQHIKYIATDVLSCDPQEYERIKKGSNYSELMKTLEYIGENSNLLIKAVVIVTKQNYKNVKGIIDEFLIRNVYTELLIVNLLSYDYSEYTSSDNVYCSADEEITRALQELQDYADIKGIRVTSPKPADKEDDCYVFWSEFQTWPVKGCDENRYGENMIPHACAAVIRGELNSLGYLFDYKTMMDAWNNPILVKLRENMMHGIYPSAWCKKCFYYHGEDSYYSNY